MLNTNVNNHGEITKMDLPDLYYFNPACEIEIADGKPFYKPPKNPLALENDLELLPMVFARSQDYVAVSQIPSYGFVANFVIESIVQQIFLSDSHHKT